MRGWKGRLIGALSLTAALILAVCIGSVRIPLRDVLLVVFGNGDSVSAAWSSIIRDIRLPRAIAAALVGGMLSLGGVTCQGLFRNPLSEPYLLGISSGAALGATLAIVMLPAGSGAALGQVGAAAFLGALAVTFGVFAAAGRGAFRLPSTLLLSGIAVAFLCQAAIWMLMTLNREHVERITFWTLGSLSAAGWPKVVWLAALTLPSSTVIVASGRVLDVLSTGYGGAHGLGLRPGRAAAIVLAATALGTAAAVSVAGSIGFIGLMVPHLMRILGGPSHRDLANRSWFGGAVLLVLADLGARTLIAPGEIPVGVITALMGAPFLLVLAQGKRREGRLDG